MGDREWVPGRLCRSAGLRAASGREYEGGPHGGPCETQAVQGGETFGSAGVCGEREFRSSRTTDSQTGQGGLPGDVCLQPGPGRRFRWEGRRGQGDCRRPQRAPPGAPGMSTDNHTQPLRACWVPGWVEHLPVSPHFIVTTLYETIRSSSASSNDEEVAAKAPRARRPFDQC